MIRDITIGQYYPAESAIHKMDARLKLMITFVFIVTLFLVNTFVGYVFVIACMGLTIRASKVPFKFMTRGFEEYYRYYSFYGGHQSVHDAGGACSAARGLFAGDNGGGTSGGENVRPSGASDYRFLCADIDDNAHSADRCHRIYFEALQKNWCACA